MYFSPVHIVFFLSLFLQTRLVRDDDEADHGEGGRGDGGPGDPVQAGSDNLAH